MTPITEAGKVSVLDIRARMNDGSQVNIEVQVCKDPDMARRSLYYWARIYSGSLHKGAPCRSLMPANSINLMDFNAFEQYTTCHHSYHVRNDETHDILIGDLEMHFIELEKYASETFENCVSLNNGSLIFLINAATNNGRC